jgi:hypothetical protein
MRTRLVIALSFALLALLPAQAAGQTRPALRIADATPLTLRGAHFQPRESIRVSVLMGTRTLARELRAGPLGGFTVRFAGVTLDYCALPLVIKAVGARSGVVRAKIPIVDCAMP